MQQVKSCFDDVTEVFKEENSRLDAKIDVLIQLQQDRLSLERDRLNFECEKAGLPVRGKNNFMATLKLNHTICPFWLDLQSSPSDFPELH